MNIVFLTMTDIQNIDSNNIYTDLIKEFLKNNHRVTIISPTATKGKSRYELFTFSNYQILKIRTFSEKSGFLIKAINLRALEGWYLKSIKTYFREEKYDLVLYSTPPITLANTIKYIKKRDGAITYLMLKDIFPQNAVDLGLLKTNGIKGVVYKYFRKKETELYKISDHIGCMSEANVKYVLAHNSFLSKDIVEVCPNSIEPRDISISDDERIQIRYRYNIPIEKIVFIYGGNLGKPQGIDFIIECIKANESRSKSYFLIVGNGTEYARLRRFFNEEKPSNSQLLTQLPKCEYDIIVKACDVGLIFLDYRFTVPNFPSRLLSYMEASLPVLAVTDTSTDIKDIVIEGQFGWWSESSDVYSFIKVVDRIVCDVYEHKTKGDNAMQYLNEYYKSSISYNTIISHTNLK